MLPYLIAGAIGFVVGKLLEEDEAPKYADGGSVLLAPNGKPSNLTPEQYKLVRTPEFKAWFGDWQNDPANASKVVDENGEPLPVYHGSKVVNIQIFNTKLGTKTKSKMQLLFGTHFAQSIIDAEIYSKEKGKIYETFLSIKNPIDLSVGYVNRDDKNFQNYYSLVNDLKLAKNNKNVFDYDLFTDSGDYGGKSKHIQRIFITQNKLDQLSPKNVRDYLIKNNFDGVIYTPYQPVGLNQISNFSKSFIALYPEQIKLADGTNTTFDGNNPDIRFDGGGNVLLAPNGKPSNLTPEQYKLVRTPEFKAWFGDWENDPANASKVVDENGEPKVKWRGDNNPKNVFDYINYDGHAVYYFGDKMFAESYGDKLNSYFINAKNPFIPNKLTDKEEKEIRNLLEKDANEILREAVKNNGFANLYDFLDNYYLIEAGFNENSNSLDILLYQFKHGINYFILELRPIIEWLKNNDYNGYESYEGNNDNIAVFNSNQIKLADGTNTSFDGNNADIRFDDGGSVLLAPNGKPSNLTPEQYKLVRTDAFKNWFGDWENSPETASKVVDENGEPLVVYHGVFSGEKFNIFERTKDIGFHFAIEKKIAQDMAKNDVFYKNSVESGESFYYKELVYECFLNVRKMANIEDLELWSISKFLDYSKEFSEAYNIQFSYDTTISKIDNLRKLYSLISTSEDSKYYPSNFDGLRYWNEYEGTFTNWNKKCFIVFNSNQIKLADGTNTTFDGNNPDIIF